MRDPKQLGQLMRDLRDNTGEAVVTYAIRLVPLLACRPDELRGLRWADIDFDKKRIIIPAAHMKTRREKVMPLSRQALTLLRELRQLDGERPEFVFVGLKSTKRPISNMTLVSALRRLGDERNDHASLQYEPFGLLKGLTYGNGIVETRSYDLVGRLSGITAPGKQRQIFGYAAANNLAAITDSLRAVHGGSFGCDACRSNSSIR